MDFYRFAYFGWCTGLGKDTLPRWMSWVRISSPAPNFSINIKVLYRKLDTYFAREFLLVLQPVPLLSHDSRYRYHFMHGCIDLVVYRKRHMQDCINNRFTGTILCATALLPIWLINIPTHHLLRQSSGSGSIILVGDFLPILSPVSSLNHTFGFRQHFIIATRPPSSKYLKRL